MCRRSSASQALTRLRLYLCAHLPGMLRGALYSLVEIGLARGGDGEEGAETFTIRALRHRFHEFDGDMRSKDLPALHRCALLCACVRACACVCVRACVRAQCLCVCQSFESECDSAITLCFGQLAAKLSSTEQPTNGRQAEQVVVVVN